jgi:flagellar biosynthesis/type III secretory pathway ATPase
MSWTQQKGGGVGANKSILDVLARLPLIRLFNLKGYSRVLPATLEERLASTSNADDHLEAATLYQNKAQELEAEAVEFETAVSKIRPLEDTKGFRRGALMTAVQTKRHRAKQMQELHLAHLEKARVLDGTAQSADKKRDRES